MQVVLFACLALVTMTLHGCGGGGDTTTTTLTTTTTTTTTQPMITTSPYAFPGIKNGALSLEWSSPDKQNLKVKLTMTYTGKEDLGWLAVAFTPDGNMDNGDYVIGYEGCVRVQKNTAKGSPPNTAGSFNVTDGAFSLTGGGKGMTLEFTRPLDGGLVPVGASGNYVITAAGSKSVTPASCDAGIAAANTHDLHDFVQASTKFGLVSAKAMEDVAV